jgi:hypothetical protein
LQNNLGAKVGGLGLQRFANSENSEESEMEYGAGIFEDGVSLKIDRIS